MTEHINDLLITRYKIYSRINYHHRSYKTALILKLLVQYLADDYLKKDGNKEDGNKRNELCPGVADLWNCLTSTLTAGDLYIIQWNDSTLISHLYQTLTDIKRHPDCTHYDIDADLFTNISNMLEEFLLNHKHFYAVFKRQSDLSSIIEKVISSLGDSIQKVIDYEERKLKEAKTESEYDGAVDSLKRLQQKKIDGIIKSADTDTFARIIPVDIQSIIKNVLDDQKKKGKIREYLFDKNNKRTNTGLPNREDESDMIYLYDPSTNKAKSYNTANLLLELAQLQNFCLQYIAYIDPIDELNSEAVIEDIRSEICNRLISESEKQMKVQFSCLRT
jgi:HD superfamily phosphohydrolase